MSEENWGDTLNESTDKKEADAKPAKAPEKEAGAKPTTKAAGGAGGLALALGAVKKQSVADEKKQDIVDAAAEKLASTTIDDPEAEEKNDDPEADEESALVTAFSGLHPDDEKAEVDIKAGKGVDLSIYKAAKTFEELGLSKELLDGVYAMKFVTPSKIQAQALPIILARNRPNLIGQAHHGSGKTAVYSLGMLSRVDPNLKQVQAICVCPVRELAIQVNQVVTFLGQFTKITSYLAVPGSSREPIQAQIVIGTPGTILAKMRAREIDKRYVTLFVADEADQMISKQGLGEQTIKIKNQLDKKCQILLFSATYADKVRKFADVVAPNSTNINIKREDLSLDAIKQFYMDCQGENNKYDVLTNIYGLLNIGQSIIFVHTVKTAKELSNRMRDNGYTVSLLHGKDMSPEERDRVMEDFRKGTTAVLITTNVLARGIDVLQVTLVINYDIPLDRVNKPDPETYIHRIGRSGRFGRKGVAINFVHDQQSKANLRYIAQYYSKDILPLPTDDLDLLEKKINDALGTGK